MPVLFTNNAVATISGYIGVADTTITIDQTAADKFPTATSGKSWFWATLVDSDGNLEIIKVTNRSYGSLSVLRAQGGTTALAFEAGSRLELRVTAQLLGDLAQEDEYEAHVEEVDGMFSALVTALNKVE